MVTYRVEHKNTGLTVGGTFKALELAKRLAHRAYRGGNGTGTYWVYREHRLPASPIVELRRVELVLSPRPD